MPGFMRMQVYRIFEGEKRISANFKGIILKESDRKEWPLW